MSAPDHKQPARTAKKKSIPNRSLSPLEPATAFPIVGIGASAGGLEAFTQLLRQLKADTGMGFVLVQHLDPEHESALRQLLAPATSMPVLQATNKLRVEPNHIYVIPPNSSMTIERGYLRLEPRRRLVGVARSIDFFFESLAKDCRECAIGVVLSGTASDGTLGLEAIKAEGGITLAQDESAKFASMPQSAVAAGCVDFVLSPENIAHELERIGKHPSIAARLRSPTGSEGAPQTDADARTAPSSHELPEDGGSGFEQILRRLRNYSGVDFSLYKPNTIERRFRRRMVLNKLNTLEEYATALRGKDQELAALYSDVLISVTSFFRNPEAFEILKRIVFPKLLRQGQGETVRVWVVGCSTGQEAYSIAMTFLEASESAAQSPKVQIFGTDLNEAALAKAREGLYPKTLVADVSPERLRRFFVEEPGGYRINKALRSLCIFARQNAFKDPPFSRLDLISCRNLLIYLEPSLQSGIITSFHYALKPGGFLLLGTSESISSFTDLFEPVDRKHKLFTRKAGPTPVLSWGPRASATLVSELERSGGQTSASGVERRPSLKGLETHFLPSQTPELAAQREADRVCINRFVPPGVLINANLQVLQFRGQTKDYLEPPTGKASFELLKMAREELRLPLRSAISKAKKENKAVLQDNVRMNQAPVRTVSIEVIPLKNLKQKCYLVLFESKRGAPPGESGHGLDQPRGATPVSHVPSTVKARQLSQRVDDLERELIERRDQQQALQQQYDTANEELQAYSEEVLSANEELQSANEELETSKEELESSNEELTTLNEEAANRNAELIRLNSELHNLQVSINTAILLLARDLTIRRFTPQIERAFNLLPTDVGRPMGAVRHNLDLENLEPLMTEVVQTGRVLEREVRDKAGRWYLLRARPYLTLDNRLDGAVLLLVDIDALKRSQQETAVARDYAQSILQTTRYPLMVLTQELRVETANAAFYRIFQVSPGQIEGRLIYELGNNQWNLPRLRELLEGILPGDGAFEDFEMTVDLEHIGKRTLLLNARQLKADHGETPGKILLAIDDITQSKRLEALHVSERRYRRLFEAAKDGMLILDPDTERITDANPFITKLLGYSRDELLGKELWELGLGQDRVESRQYFRELKEKGEIRYEEALLKTKAGEVREVEVMASLYSEGGRNVAQCNIRDITERKQMLNTLRQTKDQLANQALHLEHLVAERTAKLQETIGQLEEFSYSVSHDLRSPLRSMQGYATAVLEDFGASLPPEGKQHLENIVAAGARMEQLTRDVLTYSKVARTDLSLTPVQLDQVVQAIIDLYPQLHPPKANVTVQHPLLAVMGNESLISQVVSNLLDNAVKFVAQGVHPQVRVWTERRDREVRLWVEDNGIGVSPEYHTRIFGIFERIHPRGQYEGTGIGLAIVRKAIERMGGKVGVDSDGRDGSRFWIDLPFT